MIDKSTIDIIAEVGFPVAAALACGWFVFICVRFILATVTETVNGTTSIIDNLDARIDNMNNDLQRIDVKISHALNVEPDYERISRSQPDDHRKD
jgi:predicted PurR-regulated permease PerM